MSRISLSLFLGLCLSPPLSLPAFSPSSTPPPFLPSLFLSFSVPLVLPLFFYQDKIATIQVVPKITTSDSRLSF